MIISAPAKQPHVTVAFGINFEHQTSVQAVNHAMQERADHGGLRGILDYSEEPLVSTDIV